MTRFRSSASSVLSSVAVVALLAGFGCSKKGAETTADTGAVPAAPATSASDAALMDSGTTLLYTKKDPNAAIAMFARVIQANPQHYGAHYQMAVALDSAGRVDAAKQAWQTFLPMAQQAKDAKSEAVAQQRISAPQGALTDTQLMNNGLYLLYNQNDAAGADAQFRELLKRNPKHYGATYQLATALDKEGKAAEARPLWQKVLKMAQDTKDQATINTATARLARNP